MVHESNSSEKKAGSLFSYFFVVFIDNFGFSIVFVMFAPLFLDPSFGMVSADSSQTAKNILLGLSFVAFPLFQFFGAPILGDIADLMGRKKALYISILGLCAGFILSALSVKYHLTSLLIISRFISGFFAGNLSISLAGIADLSTTEKERGRNFGYVAALMGGSWIFAMILSGFLTNPNMVGQSGPSLVFWISAALIFLNFLIVLFFLRETHIVKEGGVKIDLLAGLKNIRRALSVKELRKYYCIYFLWIIGWGAGIQWLQAYTMENFQTPQHLFVLFMVVFGILWSCGSSFINAYCLRYTSSASLAKIGMFVIAALVFIQVFINMFFLFALIFCLAGIFSAFSMSNILNLISLEADENIQGSVMGISQSVSAIGWIVGSILAFIIFGTNSFVFYPVLGILLFIGAILLTATRKSVES